MSDLRKQPERRVKVHEPKARASLDIRERSSDFDKVEQLLSERTKALREALLDRAERIHNLLGVNPSR